ncbi:hypothetical protein [uncultured Martelella sp.]|uniref:hypothetical protein n=1 Tax=uncultured Martelella sp. TaxID=392331 RepID=UPI0029C7A556|nr:hypothetical protein [uncultured Martelella sp.]
MSFTRVIIQEAKAPATETGCRVSLYKLSQQPAKLRIIFDKAAFEAAGLTADQCFYLEIGDGEHKGLIRMVPHQSGDLTGRNRKRGRSSNMRVTVEFECGHIQQFVNRAEKACPTHWRRFEDGTIEIAMPRWVFVAKSTEVAPKPPAASDEQRRQHNEHLERRRRMKMGG